MSKKDFLIKVKRLPYAVYFIIFLIGIILSFISFLLMKDSNVSSAFLNLGIDLISVPLIFFILNLFYIGDDNNERIDEIKNVITDHLSNVCHKISSESPDKKYESSNYAKEVFNSDITDDLYKSPFYYFQGTTAKYVPIRLMGINTSKLLDSVRIVILNPTNENAIQLRAKDRTQKPGYSSKSLTQLNQEIKNEIYMSIIALFDCRDVCPIEIIYDYSGTSVYRLEIFNNHSYLSFYQSETSFKKQFPETIRYTNDSLIHKMYQSQFQRLANITKDKIIFNNRSKETTLYNHLRKIGCDIHKDTIENLRSSFEAFRMKNDEQINTFQR